MECNLIPRKSEAHKSSSLNSVDHHNSCPQDVLPNHFHNAVELWLCSLQTMYGTTVMNCESCEYAECRRRESYLSSRQQRPAETSPLTVQLLRKGLHSTFADSNAHSIRYGSYPS
ncbi:hypothetical protein TNCV_305891 [Trichonephila clavipes]|nr:hypothetical protein TNCV_305891 [Trichonephila clavipes]